MIISDKSFDSGLTSEPVASVDMYPEEANQSDQHFFESQMADDYRSISTTSSSRSSDVMMGLSSSITNNARTQQSAFRDLTIASRSGSTEDLHKANRQLSQYYIETMMDVKVISKGAQCIDKLSNLQ